MSMPMLPLKIIEMLIPMNIESKLLKKITKNQFKAEIYPANPSVKARYFHLNSKDKYSYISNRLKSMEKYFLGLLELNEFQPINFQSTKPFYLYGLISSSNGDKIENECLIFNPNDGSNVPIRLNLSSVDGYSLFNGQIVAIRGRNASGNLVSVEKIYSLPIIDANKDDKDQLEACVFRGPFSYVDIECMFSTDCGSLILLGPFCSFDADAFSCMSQFIDAVESFLKQHLHLKIVLVPSTDDNHSISVFPQPAYKVFNSRIISLSNPSYFYFNNHLVAVSNFDSLIDLCSEELFKDPKASDDMLLKSDRMARLSHHLVFQQTFVPVLFSKSIVAYGNWLDMRMAPDLYIIYSKMKHFSREVGPSTVLNVGNLNRMYFKVSSKGRMAKYEIDSVVYSE